MKDVTNKIDTKRTAEARAWVEAPAECLRLLEERRTGKGDALEIARAAAILAAKRTDELIPLCHPLPIRHADVSYAFEDGAVRIDATATVLGSTGVEMEALTAASIAALTIWDMLKPHAEDGALRIRGVELVRKTGGKSDTHRPLDPPASARVIVLSDTVAAGRKPDTAGRTVRDGLAAAGFAVDELVVLPDDEGAIRDGVRQAVADGVDWVVTVGGTGIGPRDVTVDVVRPMLEREMPGVMEAARAYGQRRTPVAMLSRGISGLIGRTLVTTFPGSRGGASETLEAILPGVLHTFEVLRKIPHARGYE